MLCVAYSGETASGHTSCHALSHLCVDDAGIAAAALAYLKPSAPSLAPPFAMSQSCLSTSMRHFRTTTGTACVHAMNATCHLCIPCRYGDRF